MGRPKFESLEQVADATAMKLAQGAAHWAFKVFEDKEFRRLAEFDKLSREEQDRIFNSKIQLLVPVQAVAVGCHHHNCRGATEGRDELFKVTLRWLSKLYLELRVGLELCGYHVLTEPDPNEALKLIRALKPACILFDLRMPKAHGFQFFDSLKSDPASRRIPAIAMSSYYTEDYNAYLSLFGIKRFLRKPFSPDNVLKLIGPAIR